MKKLLLATLLISASAMAATDSENLEICTTISESAGKVAKLHQDGMTLDELLNVPGITPFSGLVMAIYSDNTRYSTEKFQQREIQNTKNTVMISCMEAKK